jgi:muconolactone D-isomerase
VGKWANISVFNVKDGGEPHEILTSLPLYPYMKIKVIALCTHPASIETDESTPSCERRRENREDRTV